jgi:hypothetical protein
MKHDKINRVQEREKRERHIQKWLEHQFTYRARIIYEIVDNPGCLRYS